MSDPLNAEFLDELREIMDDDFGLEFVNCSPAVLGSDGETAASLFDDTSPGTSYQRIATQLSWLGTIAREGALFDIVARRKE